MPERRSDVSDARKAVIERCKFSERRFLRLISGLGKVPTPIYTHQSPGDLALEARELGAGTMIVSFHTLSYFLMLGALSDIGEHLTVVVNEGIKQRFDRIMTGAKYPLDLVLSIDPGLLRRIRKSETSLFVMADVMAPNSEYMVFPICGKAMQYTASWAKLAVRFDMNVVVALSIDHGETIEICLKGLGRGHKDVQALAFAVCDIFGEFIEGRTDQWENHPLWLQQSEDIIQEKTHHSESDILKTLGQWLSCDPLLLNAMKTHCGSFMSRDGLQID